MVRTICRYFLIGLLMSVMLPYAQAIPIRFPVGPVVVSIYQEPLLVDLADRGDAEHFAKVNELIQAKAASKIIELANGALDRDADSALALEVLGVGLLISGDNVEAIGALSRAAAIEKQYSGPQSKLGFALMEENRLDEAESALRAALAIDAHDGFTHRKLGLLYDYNEVPDKAIHHLAQGLMGSRLGYLGEALTLARLYNDRGLYTQAASLLELRFPLDAQVAQAHLTYAKSQAGLANWDTALLRFDRALELDPQNSVARLGRAVSLRGTGNDEAAESALNALIQDPLIGANAAVELGLTLLTMGKDREAERAFSQAREKGVDAEGLQETIARHYLRAKQFAKARDRYRSLIEDDAGSARAYGDYSELLLSEGDLDGSLRAIEKGRARYPGDSGLAFRFGMTLAASRNYAEAVKAFQEASKLAPNNLEILRNLSLAQTRMGDHSGALSSALAVLNLVPDRVGAMQLAALAYERSGDVVGARRLYDRILSVRETDLLALNNLASLLADTDEMERAELLATRAAQQAPENAQVLDTLGSIQLKRKQTSAALGTLRKAAELAPELGIVQYHLGLAYEELQRTGDATSSYQRAVELGAGSDWFDDANRRLAALSN